MTDTEIIIEVAKVDGWERYEHPHIQHYYRHKESGSGCGREYFNYIASRDAIVPVIEKCRRSNKDFDEGFKEELWDLIKLERSVMMPRVIEVVLSTPRQLCIALLKATGKWKE